MPKKANSGSFKPGDKRAGRRKGALNKATVEIREIARQLTTDNPAYMKALKARLDSGKIAPAVETFILSYAHGKPKETVQVEGGDNPLRAIVTRIVDPKDGES